MKYFFVIFWVILVSEQIYANSYALTGFAGIESRVFTEDNQVQNSFVFEPEAYLTKNNHQFSTKLFLRVDEDDNERTHFDIRELFWLYSEEQFEFRLGVDKVFWGVTESNHLVDVVNQTDLVESFDGEEKLGQPMLHLSHFGDYGVVDFFVLPYFRERTFPGRGGRLNGPLVIDQDNAFYESSDEQQHIDVAIRYSNSFGPWDAGISYFDGTDREPLLIPNLLANEPVLTPFYRQLKQLGVDLQGTFGAWLLKFEGVHRDHTLQTSFAYTAGAEYTFFGVNESIIDVGLLVEYNKDNRSSDLAAVLQDDIFVGGRFALNDVQGTELLIGLSQDLEFDSSRALFVEGSRRFGEVWRLTLDARFFSASDQKDPLFFIEQDDFVSASLHYFF